MPQWPAEDLGGRINRDDIGDLLGLVPPLPFGLMRDGNGDFFGPVDLAGRFYRQVMGIVKGSFRTLEPITEMNLA